MKITIDKKDYTPHFGLDFIETLDKEKVITTKTGVVVSVGTNLNIGLLSDTRNPKHLLPIIKAALCTEDEVPADTAIKGWIESQENIKDTIDAFLMHMRKASLLQEIVSWPQIPVEDNKKAAKMFLD